MTREARKPTVVPLPRPGTNSTTAASRPAKIVDPAEHFTGDTVFGVPVQRESRGTSPGIARTNLRGGSDWSEDRDTYNIHNTYITNISRCNGWDRGSRWSDCGPCHTWTRYDCHSGFSLSVGFGSGFSFGFFYGTSGAPLCSNWCNPWCESYATAWCYRPYWALRWNSYPRPCGVYHSWWNPCLSWRERWLTCGPCPWPGWVPYYGYPTLGSTTVVVASSTVYEPAYEPVAVAAPRTIPSPDALWMLLADGYDRDAEDGFILLEAAYPADQRWVAGQAFARAFRGDTVRAASLFRQAFAVDASVIARMSRDARFIARLEQLERSVEPAASAHQPSTDALLVLAAAQAARGDLSAAYLHATTAEAEGDASTGTQELVAWLRAMLRQRP